MTLSANTRLKLGVAFVIVGNLLFFTSAWVAWMPWSASFKAAVWGVLFFTPEAFTLIGVAIMGKPNYERFKAAFFAFVGRIKPAGGVGIWRHRVGLVLFFLPLVPTYIMAYKPEWLPDSSAWRWEAKIASDLVFLISLFVLGGDFWDKLHALFLPGPASNTPSSENSPPAPASPVAEADASPPGT